MEQEKSAKEQFYEEIKTIIAGAPEMIKNEFKTSPAIWINCFGSIVFSLSLLFLSARKREILPEEEYNKVSEKISKLKERFRGLQKEYPHKDTVPSEELQQELLKSLNILE